MEVEVDTNAEADAATAEEEEEEAFALPTPAPLDAAAPLCVTLAPNIPSEAPGVNRAHATCTHLVFEPETGVSNASGAHRPHTSHTTVDASPTLLPFNAIIRLVRQYPHTLTPRPFSMPILNGDEVGSGPSLG